RIIITPVCSLGFDRYNPRAISLRLGDLFVREYEKIYLFMELRSCLLVTALHMLQSVVWLWKI
ncbi:MAG: hypothetical protein MUC61_01070, partial [Amoebophilaceae bacterium]|nr:hypothetical protein [Amoebophilaceae bacterium]